MEPGTIGGFGVVYAAIVYFAPIAIGIIITFKCLPKKIQSAILERIDNI
jgi:hypothetical protein